MGAVTLLLESEKQTILTLAIGSANTIESADNMAPISESNSGVENLTDCLENLKVRDDLKKVKDADASEAVPEVPAPATTDRQSDKAEKDDQIDSGVEEGEVDEKSDDDDEKILPPLVILKVDETTPGTYYSSRGPVTYDHAGNRFQPYHRGHDRPPVCQHAAKSVVEFDETAATNAQQPLPNILIFTKSDIKTLTKIDVKIIWVNRCELYMDKYRLPDDFIPTSDGNHVQVNFLAI